MIALFTPPRIRAGLVMLLLLSGALLLGAPWPAFAQDGSLQWSRPVPLSGALGGSQYPSLVADDEGNLVLLWGVSGADGNTIYASRYDGLVWQRPVDVLVGGPDTHAQIDGRKNVHLLYTRDENQLIVESEFRFADSARGWGNYITLNQSDGGTGADFIYGENDALYTVWMQRQGGCENCWSVGFRKYAPDVSPDLTYRVLTDLTGSPQQRTQLRRAPDGTLYALWDIGPREDLRAGIQLTLSEDDGDTWSGDFLSFGSRDGDILRPLLIVDRSENLLLVYNFGVRDETYYSLSTDQGVTWTDPAPIPGLFANKIADESDYFAHITDTAGITHLVASGRASPGQQTPGLYHITWDGTSWGELTELYNEGSVPEFPAVALGNGNRLHVAFSTRDQNPVSGNVLASYVVWYTNALTNAPAATRVPLATFTPVPTATATAEPTATPTPRPTATPLPQDAQTQGQPGGPLGPMTPFLIVIVPAVLVLVGGIVFASVMRQRR